MPYRQAKRRLSDLFDFLFWIVTVVSSIWMLIRLIDSGGHVVLAEWLTWLLGLLFLRRYLMSVSARVEASRARRDENARSQSLDDELDRIYRESMERLDQIEREQKTDPPPFNVGSGLTKAQAVELFELPEGFTAAQLTKRRTDLLKRVHPDTGGSTMLTRLVNEAYSLLEKRK